MTRISLSFLLGLALFFSAFAENAGSGSYLTQFPGTDKAGRNSYPPGTPQTSGKASGRPAPTNEWYSNELINAHGDGIFNYPMALKPIDSGLAMIRNMEHQAITAENPFIVGVEGVSSQQTTVSDFSDWTVTIRWQGSSASMEATIGQGMPMVYFTKSPDSGNAEITINAGVFKAIASNIVVATGCYNRANYAIYAPAGSEWVISGNTLKSSLAGKDYWTVALLPEGMDAETTALSWAPSAFAFPRDTRAEWAYGADSGVVSTTYVVDVDLKEGAADAKPLIGLLPHHWANLTLAETLPSYSGEFTTLRGALKIVAADRFTTVRNFNGILAALPPAQLPESGYNPDKLRRLVDEVCNNTGFDDWTDSYNDGQLLNRLSQTALIAREAGYEEGANRAVTLLKNQLERWFVAEPGDVAFVFYYHQPWNTMLAYPAGHGQDSNLNDHNFHFGYFIDAAATVALFDPEWALKWGPMVDLLAADVANVDRNSSRFPYLRCFSPYSGHCWANGFATLSLGNDQESSSESMMSHAALIKWAEIRGNRPLRDAAVWMFATELSAIEEYWFDTAGRNRPASFPSVLASRVFANSYDDENFWGGGIAGSYGIQLYPVQPSSSYLVHDRDYARKLWNSMCSRTGILTGSSDPNIWYDTWAQFLSLSDPSEALGFYNLNTDKMGGKFGASHALTYYWIHSLAAIGTPDFSVSADSPLAQVFANGDVKTYVATNYDAEEKTVTFSNGQTLRVAPRSIAWFTDGELQVALPSEPETPGPGEGEDEDPGITDAPEMLFTDSDASEGTFNNPYTIGFLTLGNGSVRVSASFGKESAYVGFAGPWLFNETDGFAEIPMNKTAEERYEALLSGYKPGDEIKVRVKIAFAGGLAVTRRFSYIVGTVPETSAVNSLDSRFSPDVRISSEVISIIPAGRSIAAVYSIDGRMILQRCLHPYSPQQISIAGLAPGIYILQLTDESGKSSTLKFRKQ